eukprot:scaffold1124_cov270-Chaetoceros_neogracile.AAC.5
MMKRFLAQLYLSVLFLSSGVISFAPHALPRSSLILRSSLKDDDVQNPIAAFLNNFKLQRQPSGSMETEEERLTRLKREELMELEEKEVERALKVKEDAIPYLLLLALQFLPLVGSDRIESIAYFWGVAVATVYVGGRQVTLQESETVSSESALYAPIGASVSIGVLYALIKAGFNPAAIYAFGVTAFGALAISDIGVPLLRNLLPSSFAQGKVKVPNRVSRFVGLGDEDLPLDGLTTLILVIAWALAMTSLGAISLGSFQTAAILLAGLFCYDIFWVFGTDVMMTVATKIEAPVKFIYTAPPPIEGAEPREYPFSVLGLGDVVIPGLFVRFMTKLDAGQPALLYLDPACIGSALAVGAVNGQLQDVWNFEEENEDLEENEKQN